MVFRILVGAAGPGEAEGVGERAAHADEAGACLDPEAIRASPVDPDLDHGELRPGNA